MFVWFTIYVLYVPFIACISVQIDGLIDLRSNWNHQYNLTNLRNDEISAEDNTEKTKMEADGLFLRQHIDVTEQSHDKSVTQLVISSISRQERKVKDDQKIYNFTVHIYKQALRTFNTIKKKVDDPEIKRSINLLMKNYKDKFMDFVSITQNQKIKTELGKQKVIFNTIDTSNRIMHRLINNLTGKTKRESDGGIVPMIKNVFNEEIDKERTIEYKHVCKKFAICRTSPDFSDFIANIITDILSNDDVKIKQVIDATVEVLKNRNFDKIMSERAQEKFRKNIEFMEQANSNELRDTLHLIKNVIVNKHQPIVLRSINYMDVVERTVAFLDVVDIFDQKLPPNEENTLEWSDIKHSLLEWNKNQRTDILEIMQRLMDYVEKKGINNLTNDEAEKVINKMDILFGLRL